MTPTMALRSKVRRLLASGASGTRTLGARAHRQSRGRWIGWTLVAALLTLGPLAFNLARAASFEASILLFPRAVEPYPAVSDPAAYRPFLRDPVLHQQMRINTGPEPFRPERVTLERGADPNTIRLTVAEATPTRAQRVVNALAPQIAAADQRDLRRRADRDEALVRLRLRARPPTAERRALRGRLRRLTQFGEFPPPRILPGAESPPPRIERWADRVVADLPGEFYARPNPLWAAVAGLLVSLILFVSAIALLPPRGGDR